MTWLKKELKEVIYLTNPKAKERYNLPFLDNKETVGMISQIQHNATIPLFMQNQSGTKETTFTQELEQKRTYNRKRGLGISRKVKQNYIMRAEMNDWWESDREEMNLDEQYYFSRFRNALSTCCQNTLFREHSNNEHEFIGAHTCNHKYCNVCNAERSKNVRKSYRRFFESYPELLKQYDFMHLTLSVPHNETTGWRGQKFYASELMKEFNFMRKKPFWKKMVYAGEFGVELTKGDNGLHIHIHSMLLVHKSTQNRNELHKKILLAWNQQTATSGEFKPLEKERVESIVKGNKRLTEFDCMKLNATGATLIGLESLYIKSEKPKAGFLYCQRSGFYKKYVNAGDDFQKFMGGVMECIKYHFEPMAMKKNGKVDFDLMREILPMIAGKPLYRKFGAFHGGTKNKHEGCKLLNLNDKTLQEQVDETVANEARDKVYNPATLQVAEKEEYTYIVVPMCTVYFDHTENYKPKINQNSKKYTNTNKIRDALMLMMQKSIADDMEVKKYGRFRK